MSARFARGLATLTLVGGIAGTGLLARVGAFSTIFLVVALTLGAAAYLIATRRKPLETQPDAVPIPDALRKRILRLTAVLFFLFTAGSLFVLRSENYGKPLAYFGFMAASAAVIALRIGLLGSTKEVPVTLGMIMLVALNFFGSDQVVFPLGIGGADASTHLQFLVNPIVQTGFVPPTNPCGLVYGTFPAHHVFVAMTAILTGSDPTRTYYSLVALVMTAPVLAAFLLGRPLFGARIGLLAALVLSGSSYFIFWAAHDAPLSFAVPLVGFLLLSFLTMLRGPNVRMIFVAGVVPAAHPLSPPPPPALFGVFLFRVLPPPRPVGGPPPPRRLGALPVGGFFSFTP